MNGEQAARESTLQAVHQDQLQLQDQLRDLSQMLTRVEEHLLGSPRVQMVAAQQAQASKLAVPAPEGLVHNPPPPGMLPQMCELGRNNSNMVSDVYARLQSVARLLGVHDG